jgi:flagellar basal-body rod protein FlgG
MVGTGVRVVATQKEHSQGNIVQTGNSLDVAIQGKGYFQVLHPDGNIVYTRDGTFSLTADGNIVTPNGYELQPAMTVPTNATSLTIGSDGVVSALVSGNSTPTQIGQIELAYFVNPQGLEPIGDNLYRETNASGGVNTAIPGTDSTGTLIQSALESSNVNVVEELVNMIETQRAYEMNSKAISTTDEMLSYVNQQL